MALHVFKVRKSSSRIEGGTARHMLSTKKNMHHKLWIVLVLLYARDFDS
jgi:hypothetical protein